MLVRPAQPSASRTTRTLDVQTTRGVAVAPDVFSFLLPAKKPSAEPRASSVDQASTAGTPGRLEFEVFDPHTTFCEPTSIEINGREERVVGLDGRGPKVAEPDQPPALGQTSVARLDESAFGAMTAQLEGVLAGFGDLTNRVAAGLAEADRLATVVSGVESRIAALREREHSLTETAERIASGLAEADRLATVVSGVEARIATLREREHSLTQAAERIGPGMAEADRLTAFMSRVKTRIAALDSVRSNDDGSRLGEPTRPIGRLAVATAVLGGMALVALGSGLVARLVRPPSQAPVAQDKSEAPLAAAASRARLATAAPTKPGVIPAATMSAPRQATSSKAATQDRGRRAQPAGGDPSAPPVFAGALAVQSSPAGGTVFLDRRRVGETPLQLTGITAGSHVIWIESPGHARWTTAVQVNANKLVTVIATLERRR